MRAMCGLPGMTPLLDKLYTLMTLNSPHCGLIYNQRTASWGMKKFLKRILTKISRCIVDFELLSKKITSSRRTHEIFILFQHISHIL